MGDFFTIGYMLNLMCCFIDIQRVGINILYEVNDLIQYQTNWHDKDGWKGDGTAVF